MTGEPQKSPNISLTQEEFSAISLTQEEFSALLDKYDYHFNPGDVIAGTVFSLEPRGALIDIGAEIAAYIPIQEMSINRIDSPDEVLQLNETREFFILTDENEDGQLTLSIRRLEYMQAWERVRQMQAENVTVYATIFATNQGGALARIEGLRGFIPGSHISTRQPIEDLVGEELTLKFLEVDEERNRLVLSHRRALVERQASQFEVGSVVSAVVRGIKSYGVFVDIVGVTALLYITEISHVTVETPHSVFQVNDEIKAIIIDLDLERGRISVSTKALELKPGDILTNPQQVYEHAEEAAARYLSSIQASGYPGRIEEIGFAEEEIISYEQALQETSQELFPEEWAETQVKLATAYLNQTKGDRAENLEQAISACESALQVYTREAFPEDWAKTQTTLAQAYSERIRGDRAENLERAIAACEFALQVYTREAFPEEWATTQMLLGKAYLESIQGDRAENLERAIASYNRVLQYQPDIAEVWNHRGRALIYLGKAEEAITNFNRAIELKPDFFGAIAQRGETLVQLGHYEEARQSYEQALAICRERGDRTSEAICLISIANVYQALKQYQNAIDCYERALEIEETEDKATKLTILSGLTQALLQSGNFERAIAVSQSIPDQEKRLEILTDVIEQMRRVTPASAIEQQTILFLAASPADQERLRSNQELREIDAGLRRIQTRSQFNLEQRLALRPRDMQRALLDVRPQIIHFSGGVGQEGLSLEDENGNTRLIDSSALATLFELFADQIRCVVLSGCYSTVQAQAISQHIPYVIGINRAIDDRSAIAFAVAFYDALGTGRDIEFAYRLGCISIQLAGIDEPLTPVLLKQTAQSSIEPANVFISYSHQDAEFKDELMVHLVHLKQQGKIRTWHDQDIAVGAEWATEIEQQLETADIILLLISPQFLASEYCYNVEMQRAVQRHDEGTARVVPIILKPADWAATLFSKFQVLPKDARPLTFWNSRGDAWLSVVEGICRVIDSLPKNRLRIPFVLPQLDIATFTGRELELRRLEELLITNRTLEGGKVAILTGLGGSGKSTLACHFATIHRDKFPDGVIGLRVDGKNSHIIARELAQSCGKEIDPEDERDAATLMHDIFAHRRMLLILDNVDRPELRDLLPSGQRYALIVTTRDRLLPAYFQIPSNRVIDLSLLSKDAARELLRQILGAERIEAELEVADLIIEMTGGLPLALQIVGSTLQGGRRSLADYAESLQQEQTRLQRLQIQGDLDLNITASFNLSLALLDDAETDLFACLSVCDKDEFSSQAAIVAGGLVNDLEAQDLLDRLYQLSFLNKSELNQYSFHPLTRIFAKALARQRGVWSIALERYTQWKREVSKNPVTVSYNLLMSVLTDIVSVGEEVEITINLNSSDSYSNDSAYLLEIPSNEISGNELNILLNTSGLCAEGDSSVSLPLDLSDFQSESLSQAQTACFRLTALRPGVNTITAEIYRGNTFETTLETTIQVIGLEEANFFDINIKIEPRPVSHPDLVLQVQTFWNATASTCTFLYHLESFRAASFLRSGISYRSRSLSSSWLQQVHNIWQTELETLSDALPTDGRSQLTSLGHYLFQHLFPTELQADLRNLNRYQALTLQILADQDAQFPWPLLHTGREFLAERFIIGHWLWDLNNTQHYEFPVGAINLAHYATVEHPEFWATLLSPPGAPPTFALTGGVLDDLLSIEAMRGLHLLRVGRSTTGLERRDAPVPLEAAAEELNLDHKIRPIKLNLRRNRPLVTLGFLRNSEPELTALYQTWVSTFLRAGCSAFVGPLWAINPATEAAFISSFYYALWTGDSLGGAFHTARRMARAANPESMDWLAYCLFGDPMARPYRPVPGQGYAVVEPVGQDIADPVTPGSTVRFRVSLRRTPPVWHDERVIEVAEDLSFNDLQAHIAVSGLQVTPATSIELRPTPSGNYLGWFNLTVPADVSAESALVQVYFADGMQTIHTLSFPLTFQAAGGDA